MLKTKKIFLTITIIFYSQIIESIQHLNFFEPYEFLLDLNRMEYDRSKCKWEISGRLESGFNFRGYPIDFKDSLVQGYNNKITQTNPVQYLNLIESDFASFFGNELNSKIGQFTQQYTPYQGVTASQLVIFEGSMNAQSLTGSIEYWCDQHIKIGFYFPLYNIELNSLSHKKNNKKEFYENSIFKDIYQIYQLNNSPAKNYTQTGLGDSELLISWQHYFYENKDFISGLLATLRAGLYLPTGMFKNTYSQTFLKLPLGYDCSWGIPFGGSIEIDIGCYGGAGISADCTTFFAKLMPRNIKTDMRQTDMLLCNEAVSLLEPGFRESFSVILTGHNDNKSILGTLAYQYNKQNESDIVLCQTNYSNMIAQTADILENWTNHNIIFIVSGEKSQCYPKLDMKYELFFKYGFTGCRSIVANTAGLQITFLF